MLKLETKTLNNDQVVEILKIIATAKPERMSYIFGILEEYGFDFELIEETVNSRNSNYKANFSNKLSVEENRRAKGKDIEVAFEAVAEKGVCSINKLAEFLSVTAHTARKRILYSDTLLLENGLVYKV